MYTQYTQASFTQELAEALGDSGRVYWVQDELNRALNEALLYWGALTSYWTTRATFQTSPGVAFYDLSVQLPNSRTRAYTVGNLFREIQYHLFEPPNGVAGGGTGATAQFTVSQNFAALQRHRNRFVLDAKVPMSTMLIATPAVNPQVALPETVALIDRVAWIETATGITTPLRRSDSFAAQSFNPTWNQTTGRPYAYTQAEAMPGTMTLIPPPANSGSIHLTYVPSKTLVAADSTPLEVPDEFASAIKWGALAEIMATNSEGYDPIRSKYATERYAAAIETANLRRSLLHTYVNGVGISLSTLRDLDSSRPYWQTSKGKPSYAATSYDLIALYPVPDGVYSVNCDIVQAAPLPASPGVVIQVGPEEAGYLMGYCRHILQVKVGGVEFAQSMPLYDNFLKGAAQRSKLVAARARYLTPLFTKSLEEERVSPAA